MLMCNVLITWQTSRLQKLHMKLNSMNVIKDEPQHDEEQGIVRASTRETDKDKLGLIKPGGPSPGYNAVQRAIRDALANVPDRLLVVVGAPGTGKTWTYISFLSEMLHANKFKVIIAAPTHQVLDDITVCLHKDFQQHPSLRSKVICRIKSMDLVNKNRRVTCAQITKTINMVTKERRDVGNDNDIIERVAFDFQLVEIIKKNSAKYGSLEQLKTRCSKGAATTDKEMQCLNRVLKAARAETLRETDVALITCASASNRFFCKHFSADFVVIEDNPSELVSVSTLSALDKTFHPKMVIFVGTLLNDGDAEGITDRLDAAFNTDHPGQHSVFEGYRWI